jgi:K+-transporting ATPase ATPase B chain
LPIISNKGATPLAISVNGDILGIVVLSDTLKPGIRERMQELRKMAIRTIMVRQSDYRPSHRSRGGR